MIKIMDRSLWYYIKRPNFALSLLYSSPSVRTYSLFVMDLIEANYIEYDDDAPYRKEFKIKNSTEHIDHSNLNSHVRMELNNIQRSFLDHIAEARVKSKIAKHLNTLKGEDIQNG